MKKYDISDLKNTAEQEVVGCYLECHGPPATSKEELHEWVARMVNMLGLDDCKGFLIKSRMPHLNRLWMGHQHWCFEPSISQAKRFTWGEAAVKITNNAKLEAIRIVDDDEAVDSKGRRWGLKPAPALITEGPPPMPMNPEYESRWGMDEVDNHYGIGSMGQNGERQPEQDTTDGGY